MYAHTCTLYIVYTIYEYYLIGYVGFGLVGIPENLIRALRENGPRDLTVVSNEAGYAHTWNCICNIYYTLGFI